MATPINPIGQASFSGPVAFNYYPLLSDGDDIVSRPASIASGGGIFRRGAIVKWDPATGLITAPVAATDCNAIVVNDVDATSATQAAAVYVGGKFKADAVIWPGALSHALVTENLRHARHADRIGRVHRRIARQERAERVRGRRSAETGRGEPRRGRKSGGRSIASGRCAASVR